MKTAVEVGREIMAAKPEPMSFDVSRAFAQCAIMENQKVSISSDEAGAKVRAYRVIDAWCKWANAPVNIYAKLFMSAVVTNPGDCVLYVAALKALSEKHGGAEITMAILAAGFPIGFPSRETLSQIWDGQKRHPHPSWGMDNWLDYPEAWGLPPVEGKIVTPYVDV